jgi:hypothetical protein
VYFCATKLGAFASRGKGDYMASHDLEDLLSVIDGRPELVREIQSAPLDVLAYIASEFRTLLDTEAFVDALPGHLHPDAASQGRVGTILDRMRQIRTFGASTQ